MDVALGVAVTGRVARLAMIGASAAGGQLLDQYALDLTDDSASDLAETIVGTYRAVAESGNRVAATRLCLPDASAGRDLAPDRVERGRAERRSGGGDRGGRGAGPQCRRGRRVTAGRRRHRRAGRWSARTRSRRRYWRRCPSARPVRPSRAPLCCSRCRRPPPGSCWSGSAWTSIRLRPSSVRRCRWRCRRIRASRSPEVPRRRPTDAGFAPAGAATQMGPARRRWLAPRCGHGAGFGCDADGAAADATRWRRLPPTRRRWRRLRTG